MASANGFWRLWIGRGALALAAALLTLHGTAVWCGAAAQSAKTESPVTQSPAAPVTQSPIATSAASYLERYPISPPDTSSPRATLESFLLIMREAERLWTGARASLAARPGAPATADERRAFRIAQVLLDKAAEVFDLSEVPESARSYDSLATVLRFKEILERLELPDMAAVPGAPAGAFLDSKAQADLPVSWTIPYSDLTVVRQTTGNRTGRYLFSAETVRRIEGDYLIVKGLPSRSGNSVDLFEFFRQGPGGLMPPRWFALVENGPSWLRQDYDGQPVWKLLGRALAVLFFGSIPLLLHLRLRARPAPSSHIRRALRSLYLPATLAACIYGLRYVMQEEINLIGPGTVAATLATEVMIWSVAAWVVYHSFSTIGVWLLASPKLAPQSLDASLVRTGCRVIGSGLALLILGYGATQVGIPVYGVVAGLGIGGLAIALAAQPTMENLIGGIILYADQVLRVGDFCKLGALSGTIETIGIRSTRLRALDGTLVTVANADLVKMQIVNLTRRNRSLLRTTIGLRYETTADQLHEILGALRRMLHEHPKVITPEMRVRLVAFGGSALEVELFAPIATGAYAEFLAVQEGILFKAMEIVEAAGSGLAFPSTTAYLTRDKGISRDKSDHTRKSAPEPEPVSERDPQAVS